MARAALLLSAALCGLLPLALTQQTQPSVDAPVRAACGVCHALPPPDVLPRYAWRDEIVRMMYIRENRLPPLGAQARATVQLPPDFQLALDYYLARAPERLAAPEPWPDPRIAVLERRRCRWTCRDACGVERPRRRRLFQGRELLEYRYRKRLLLRRRRRAVDVARSIRARDRRRRH